MTNQNLLQKIIYRLNLNDKYANAILENNTYILAILDKSIEAKKPILLDDED